jgi:hypothetical protein
MISAGKMTVKKLQKSAAGMMCKGFGTRLHPATMHAACKSALDKAIKDSANKYKLSTDQQLNYYYNMVRRFTQASVFRTLNYVLAYSPTSDMKISDLPRANRILRSYVLSRPDPGSGRPNPRPRTMLALYSPIHGSTQRNMSYFQAIDLAALIASKAKSKDDMAIYIPPPLAKEMDLINKIFPKRWARHLIEQAGRMYVTTLKELKIKGVQPTAINYDNAAQGVVTRIRRMAWASINNKKVKRAPQIIDDATAEAQYKKIARAETSAAKRKIFEGFMEIVTDTFVLKADQVQDPANASKKIIKISFRRAPVTFYIKRGYTKELRRTDPKTMPRFTFFRKIKQADIIRDQMTHALKRLYPHAAGMDTADTNYDANRKALDGSFIMVIKNERKKVKLTSLMVAATIEGMNRVFEEHYGLKNGSVTKTSADPMSLHELEGKDVVMIGKTKKPDYVVFKLSSLKSTGGVPLSDILPIVNGHPGNKRIRLAVAIRRYQQAKDKLGDGAKDPAKLEKMVKTLVAQLKNLPDKKLLMTKVAEVAKDGTVKIVIAPKELYPYTKDTDVKNLGAKQLSANPFKKEYVDVPQLAFVDVVDRIKKLFDDLIESNKSKLKEPGAKDALAKALVRHLVLKVKNNPKPLDGIGILWTKTGKGGSFKIKPTEVKTRVRVPARDSRGRIRTRPDGRTIYRWKTVMKDGFKISDIELPDRFGGSGEIGKGIFWKKKFSSGFELSLGGSLTGIYLRAVSGTAAEKDSGGIIGEINVKGSYKKFTAGVSVGMAGLKFEHQNASYDETKPIVHAPFSPIGGFMDVGGLISVMAGYGFTKNISLNASGGIIDSKPAGFSSRPFSLDMHTGSLPYVVPIVLGAGGSLSFAYEKFSASVYAKGGKPFIPSLKASSAWSDGSQITMGAYGRFHINKNFAISGAYSYGMQRGGKEEGADGALKLTPLSQHSVMAGAHVNLLKKRLLLDLAYRGVFQKADQETGLQSAAEHTVSLSAMMLFAKVFGLFGSASYTRRSDKIKWYEQNGNSLTPNVNSGEIVKEGFGWTLGLGWVTSANTWLALGYTGGRIANRDIGGVKPLHSIFAIFSWVFGEHKAYEKGN